MSIQIIKKQILPTLKRQGAIKVAIFGSFAIGKEKNTSDVDLLVNFKKDISLMQLAAIKIKLEAKLERKVDLLTYGGINPHLKKIILRQQKIIYEKRQ